MAPAGGGTVQYLSSTPREAPCMCRSEVSCFVWWPDSGLGHWIAPGQWMGLHQSCSHQLLARWCQLQLLFSPLVEHFLCYHDAHALGDQVTLGALAACPFSHISKSWYQQQEQLCTWGDLATLLPPLSGFKLLDTECWWWPDSGLGLWAVPGQWMVALPLAERNLSLKQAPG